MSEKYFSLITKQGQISNLGTLQDGEFGFANDTSQVFIGTNPDNNTFTTHNRVLIRPIPFAHEWVQNLLDNSLQYRTYTLTEDMYIETESDVKAAEIMGFINNAFAVDYSDVKPIAKLDQNVELITNLNIHEYSDPAYYNVDYSPTIGFSRQSNRVLTKTLDQSSNYFLEFDRTDSLYVEVEYSLVHGSHRRSGKMVIATDASGNDKGFVDQYTTVQSTFSVNHISFDISLLSDRVQIVFDQPNNTSTKIFYRLSKWGLDGV